MLKRLFTIKGRSSRSEFLKNSLLVITPFLVFGAIYLAVGGDVASLLTFFSYLTSLVLQPVQSAKRLHDLDASGGWAFLILIPIVYAVMLIYLASKKGTAGENRFGHDPLAAIIGRQTK